MTKGDVVVLAVPIETAGSGRRYAPGTKVRILGLRCDGLALVTTRLASRPTWTTTFAVATSDLQQGGGRTGQPS